MKRELNRAGVVPNDRNMATIAGGRDARRSVRNSATTSKADPRSAPAKDQGQTKADRGRIIVETDLPAPIKVLVLATMPSKVDVLLIAPAAATIKARVLATMPSKGADPLIALAVTTIKARARGTTRNKVVVRLIALAVTTIKALARGSTPSKGAVRLIAPAATIKALARATTPSKVVVRPIAPVAAMTRGLGRTRVRKGVRLTIWGRDKGGRAFTKGRPSPTKVQARALLRKDALKGKVAPARCIDHRAPRRPPVRARSFDRTRTAHPRGGFWGWEPKRPVMSPATSLPGPAMAVPVVLG